MLRYVSTPTFVRNQDAKDMVAATIDEPWQNLQGRLDEYYAKQSTAQKLFTAVEMAKQCETTVVV